MKEEYTLVNSQNGNVSFKLFSFDDCGHFEEVQRLNCYSLVWIKEGKGTVKADFSEYNFERNVLFSFSPYQPFIFSPGQVKGLSIQFHPDFFCIHKPPVQIACNGVLFNNIYQPPFIEVTEIAATSFDLVVQQMRDEMQSPAAAQYEYLLSYLKIFLITASRLRAGQDPVPEASLLKLKEPFILQHLKDAIEKDFKTKHSASEYASALNISPKALAKITKTYFKKTITNLIAERIIIEAKRELYLTNKAIKEIAYELGYEDEYYFSRFFKANADISPQTYRDTVGFARGLT